VSSAPIYPIYIPSKGRADRCLTARFLIEDGVPFTLVVEPQETEAYAAFERVLVLPFRDRGLPATRNYIKEHAAARGVARHWQLDDNIRAIRGYAEGTGKLVRWHSGDALARVEELVDRYENVGIAGLRHQAFQMRETAFVVNRQAVSCVLVDNALPFRWRGFAHHDTDYSLQVLASGRCTILVNAFVIDKAQSSTMAGGLSSAYAGDGRLKKTHEIQRRWPGLGIRIVRRNGRPTADTQRLWRHFRTGLAPRASA
jgi:hypothetical protein